MRLSQMRRICIRTPTALRTVRLSITVRLKITADNRAVIENTYNSTLRIEAVKLELGEESTLKWDMVESHGINLTRAISSAADPDDPYANSGYGRTNPNLLDNPWFGSEEVINQRGVTSGQTTHAAYTVDRWFTSYGNALGTWSIGANGLTLSAASGTYALMQQNIPASLATQLTGKTVTCSYLTAGLH